MQGGGRTSDAEMQRVVPPELVLLLCKQPVGRHHDQRVARLHGEHEVVVVMLAADVSKLKRTGHHASWCVAIERQDTCRQTAVVRSNSHSGSQLLALQYQGREHVLNVRTLSLKICGILVVDLIKRLAAIDKISWVDPDLLKGLCYHHRDDWLEMDVSNQGCGILVLHASSSNQRAQHTPSTPAC